MKKSWFCGGLAALVILAGCAGTPEEASSGEAPAMSSDRTSNEAMTLPIPSVGGQAEKPSAVGAGQLTWDKPASWSAVRCGRWSRLFEVTRARTSFSASAWVVVRRVIVLYLTTLSNRGLLPPC